MNRSLLNNKIHQIFKELTVSLMTFDIGEARMRRKTSSHRKDLWPEMTLEGFSQEEDKNNKNNQNPSVYQHVVQ